MDTPYWKENAPKVALTDEMDAVVATTDLITAMTEGKLAIIKDDGHILYIPAITFQVQEGIYITASYNLIQGTLEVVDTDKHQMLDTQHVKSKYDDADEWELTGAAGTSMWDGDGYPGDTTPRASNIIQFDSSDTPLF